MATEKKVKAVKASAPTYESVFQDISSKQASVNRARMVARLLENQPLDAWMTFELMEAAMQWVHHHKPNGIEWHVSEDVQTRDLGSITTARMLKLENTAVDSFYNFQSIRVDRKQGAAMRHQNRPDGMFLVQLETTAKGLQDMVLFYEGDVHGKDEGKSLYNGCKNNHKMYQAIAQAQSRNPDMAGCVVFAAMQYLPTDRLMEFLDDMLNAHIFVCVAIADWNKHIGEQRRKATLIGGVFDNSLQHSTEYDFVFGINIGLEQGVPGWEDTEFRKRVDEMLSDMQIPVMSISLQPILEGVAAYSTRTTLIGCVRIVICAIPRPKKNILTPAPREALFIYPLHIQEHVRFQGKSLDTQCANNVFATVLNFAGPIPAQLHFKKNMMSITSVSTNAPAGAAPAANSCSLPQTNGFFFAALPLAYYTIQQFEFVNMVLNYNWSPTRFEFTKALKAFRANKKKLTGDLDVTMFKTDQSSLFHVICASANTNPPIAEDFQMFLKECCRWNETDGAPAHSSPTIIFRTLGIFSLQNAIDFACAMQANPNKTYASLLASYPPGTQMLIQQCMKKLSANEAYAYIGKGPDDKFVADIPKVDDDGSQLVSKLIKAEKSILRLIFHSTWEVTVNGDDGDGRPDELALKLLKAYQESVVSWKCEPINWTNDARYQAGSKPSETLSDMLIGTLTQMQVVDQEQIISLSPKADDYEPGIAYAVLCKPREYPDQKYVCSAELPTTLKYLNYAENTTAKKDDVYKAKWGNVPITFKMLSENVLDGAKQVANTAHKTFMDWLREQLGLTDTSSKTIEELKQEFEKLNKDEKNAAVDAQNGGNDRDVYPMHMIHAP